MKVLFVCRANVGRSQAAMELFRLKGGYASSAGTKVDIAGQHLKDRERAKNILEVMMSDYGIDMSENIRRQLESEDIVGYDKVVVMAEPDFIPDWLKRSEKFVYWKISDPAHEDVQTTRAIVEEIKDRVDSLD